MARTHPLDGTPPDRCVRDIPFLDAMTNQIDGESLAWRLAEPEPDALLAIARLRSAAGACVLSLRCSAGWGTRCRRC